MISHNLFAIKFYTVPYINMTEEAPSVVTARLLTVILKCTRNNKPLFFVRYLHNTTLHNT
jgi:hypothetical protein